MLFRSHFDKKIQTERAKEGTDVSDHGCEPEHQGAHGRRDEGVQDHQRGAARCSTHATAPLSFTLHDSTHSHTHAHIERGERLKQAKVEAEAEINAFRKQQEHAFQMNGNTDVCLVMEPLA